MTEENNMNEVVDVERILRLLPHRYPFLLVDKVIEYKKGESITAIKNVTFNEPHFTGHFPNHPVMPGVLIIEAMAQASGVLGGNAVGDRLARRRTGHSPLAQCASWRPAKNLPRRG